MDALSGDQDLCRTCLHSVDDGLVSLYQDGEEVSIFDGISIAQMINECCVHPVKKDDPFSKKICIKCIDDIKIAYNFRKQSENAFKTLKSFLIDDNYSNHDDDDDDDDDKTEDVNAFIFKPPIIYIENLRSKDLEQNLPPTEKCVQTDEVAFYPCERCDKKYFDYDMLKKHRLVDHKGSENQCRICLKTYQRISHLKRHMATSHPQIGIQYKITSYNCKICHKPFTKSDRLKKHIQQKHDGENDILVVKNDNLSKKHHQNDQERSVKECSICSQKCETDEILKKHLQQHMQKHNEHGKVLVAENDKNIKMFHCTLCTESFQNENNYKNHKCENKNDRIDNNSSLPIALMEPIMETEKVEEEIYENDFLDTNDDNNENFSQDDNENIVDDFFDTNDDNNENMNNSIDNNDDGGTTTDEDDKKPLAELVRKFQNDKTSSIETNKIKSKRKQTARQEISANKKSKKEIASADEKLKKEITAPGDEKLIKKEIPELKKSKKKNKSEPSLVKIREKKVHRCEQCNKVFTRSTHLRRHTLTHSGEKPFSCDICLKRFTRVDHLNLHKLGHADIKPFTCDICNQGFVKSYYLRRHIESRHGNKLPSPKTELCEICKRYFSKKYMKVHVKSHLERRWSCKSCDERFDDRSKLTEHIKIHANEKPFLCSECGLRFVRNDYLVIHMRRHKGEKPYKCKFCDKGFPRATDLTVHERYHTGEKSHLCTICGKGFHRAYNLLVHTRIHTGERPYQCPQCPRCFAQGNDLKAHIRRHTGERFKCDICGSGFIQIYHLTQHKRAAHGIETQSHIRRVEKFITPTEQQKQVEALQSKLDESKSIINSDSTTKTKNTALTKITAQSSKLTAPPQTQIYDVKGIQKIEENDMKVVTKQEEIEIEEHPLETF